MHKTLIFSFIITAGLLLSASLTTNAETTAATTETTTSTGSIFNEANIQKDKGYISNAEENSASQDTIKDLSKLEESPSISEDSSIKDTQDIKNIHETVNTDSNKSTNESTLTINVINESKETTSSDNLKNEDTISSENVQNENIDNTKTIISATKNTSSTANSTEPSSKPTTDSAITAENKTPEDNISNNETKPQMADTELSNKNQTSITHNITDIPEVTDKLTPKLPDAAIINYDDGTTSRIPINWLLINNSNVGSINISNNNYLFDYSIKDSFNKTNIVTVNIVVTVVNPEGYLNNSSTKNTNFVNKNNTPKRYNTFKTQSLNQNKLSTVPKTYDYSVTILTLTLFIFSFSCMVVLNFKKSK